MARLLAPDVAVSEDTYGAVEIADIFANVTVDGVPLAATPYTATIERSQPHDDLVLFDGARAYLAPGAPYGTYQQGVQVILHNGALPPPNLDDDSDEYMLVSLTFLDPGGCAIPVCSCTVPYCP